MRFAPISDRHDRLAFRDGGLRWAGLALFALGLMIFEWPRFVMGSQLFVQGRPSGKNHELITERPPSPGAPSRLRR